MNSNESHFAFLDAGREAELIAEAQMGDHASFLELARHYQRPLYRLLYAMCRRENGAATQTEEALSRAWREIQEYPSGRRFFPWLLRIARSLPPAPKPSDADWNRADPLLSAIDALRTDDLMTLALRVVERFRYEEIAALLDIPVGVAILRIAQARAQILAATAGLTVRST
jgi:DNA-directed RNA polymerase specialized sigma24 family protein